MLHSSQRDPAQAGRRDIDEGGGAVKNGRWHGLKSGRGRLKDESKSVTHTHAYHTHTHTLPLPPLQKQNENQNNGWGRKRVKESLLQSGTSVEMGAVGILPPPQPPPILAPVQEILMHRHGRTKTPHCQVLQSNIT